MSACINRVTNCNKGLSSYDNEWYVFSKFECAMSLNSLLNLRPNAHLIGFPALVEIKRNGQVWSKPRPIFNFFMFGAVVCITGFTDKDYIVSSLFPLCLS